MNAPGWLRPHHPLWVAIVATGLTLVALGIAGWQLVTGHNIEAANWVMAAGGLGLIVFSAFQLHREAQREAERLAAARAKVKPLAWLARRSCEQAVIESGTHSMFQWLGRWYRGVNIPPLVGNPPSNQLDILEAEMRETVTLATEAAEEDVKAADSAFNAFIVAANILNELSATLNRSLDSSAYRAQIPSAREAVRHLARAAHALEALAPRGAEEPAMPTNPKFTDDT